MSLTPNGGLDRPGASVGAAASWKIGPLAGGLAGQWSNDCKGETKSSMSLGPVGFDQDKNIVIGDPKEAAKPGVGGQIKAFGQYCKATKF